MSVFIITPILVIIIILLLTIILFGIFFTIDTFLDLPYVATKRDKIETIIKLAQIKPKETVVDLGSGDGRLIFAAARAGAHAIGYEINPFLILLTQIKAILFHPRGESSSHLGGVFVKRQNLWKADLSIADVIFVYGRKKTMQKFEDFAYKKAKKGTRIVVNTNRFPNKKPLKSNNGIFLYRA
ncbi:hypothetical protein A2Z54_01915 [Candidatus Curtissbacteria bacterium RIFCSPHIGHO2_02_39_8]|nr:MAG: hypothetical protein A2Z54_01915 [Candidatus Curtissbacteria bacterium RIFCSPHIGHO2_02_39_8]